MGRSKDLATGSITTDFSVDTDTLKVNTSDDRVLINTTLSGRATEGADILTVASPDNGHSGITVRSGASNYGSFYFSDATTGAGEYAASMQFNHSNNQLALGVGGSDYLKIDSSGRVTKPSQPAFNAYRNTVLSTLTTWGAVPDYTGTRFNHGSHFNTSNGRFTAPVAGEYLFGVNNNMGSQQNVKSWRLYVNGSAWIILSYADVSASWQNLSASTLVTLNANDYIQFYYRGYPDYGNDWLNVYGYLMG